MDIINVDIMCFLPLGHQNNNGYIDFLSLKNQNYYGYYLCDCGYDVFLPLGHQK